MPHEGSMMGRRLLERICRSDTAPRTHKRLCCLEMPFAASKHERRQLLRCRNLICASSCLHKQVDALLCAHACSDMQRA